MFDPTIAFDKDYMVFVAPKPGLFPKQDGALNGGNDGGEFGHS